VKTYICYLTRERVSHEKSFYDLGKYCVRQICNYEPYMLEEHQTSSFKNELLIILVN
jgi:hypothetical protein